MPERKRFLSEEIANLVCSLPGLDIWRKYDIRQRITTRERKKLRDLEEEVWRKIQTLQSAQNPREAPGYRGAMMGFIEILKGEDGRLYKCTVASDVQRLEITIVDWPPTDEIIRKYRIFIGKFEIKGKTRICDLSALEDKTFSWQRNPSDNDYPPKGLTLRESYQFLKEILRACPENLRSSQSDVALIY